MFALIMISLYLAALLWIGRWAHVGYSRHTASDYYVASRSLGPFMLVMSIFGTTMTSFALVGSTGEAWQRGHRRVRSDGLVVGDHPLGLLLSDRRQALALRQAVRLQHADPVFPRSLQSPTFGLLLFVVVVSLVIPYIIINILAAGETIQILTKGALPALFPGTAGAVPQCARLRRGLLRGLCLRLRRRGCAARPGPT